MRFGCVLAALFLASTHAAAATCSVSAVSLAFGSYNPFKAGHTDTTGNIAVTCTGKPGEVVAYGIALSAGGGGFPVRRMRTPSGYLLNYNIYTNAARTFVWGDGSSGSLVVNDSYTLGAPVTTRNYAVYGRAFGGQKSVVGIYGDAIVATLNF
jgi:spore coat protein U-like protein